MRHNADPSRAAAVSLKPARRTFPPPRPLTFYVGNDAPRDTQKKAVAACLNRQKARRFDYTHLRTLENFKDG